MKALPQKHCPPNSTPLMEKLNVEHSAAHSSIVEIVTGVDPRPYVVVISHTI